MAPRTFWLGSLTLLLASGAGCTLPRAALPGSGGVDVGTSAVDVGTATHDTGAAPVDAGQPPRVDAWRPPPGDAGLCARDSECPADEVTTGTCAFTSPCATSAPDLVVTTVHYTCTGGACVPQTSTTSGPCARETDGDPCGGGMTSCGACSTSTCGASGTQSCTGMACSGGQCLGVTTVQPCTTPGDMCGTLSGWSPCYYSISRGRCIQTRSWGACVFDRCVDLTGQSETRDCSC